MNFSGWEEGIAKLKQNCIQPYVHIQLSAHVGFQEGLVAIGGFHSNEPQLIQIYFVGWQQENCQALQIGCGENQTNQSHMHVCIFGETVHTNGMMSLVVLPTTRFVKRVSIAHVGGIYNIIIFDWVTTWLSYENYIHLIHFQCKKQPSQPCQWIEVSH